MIKALFFDIDGTLVSFNTHAIPPTTIEAIAAAKAKGIRIFIATVSYTHLTLPTKLEV